ncbi:Ank3 [Symbiodinium sp. CCMP2592]|nr:Ank3 [Symbiodinium sp. CCMP2592]
MASTFKLKHQWTSNLGLGRRLQTLIAADNETVREAASASASANRTGERTKPAKTEASASFMIEEEPAMQVGKLLKAELDGLDATKFMTTDMDKLVADCVVFMVALVKLTLRPSKKMLEAAAKAAFSKPTEQDCEKFASAICRGIQYCRKKVSSMTSGKKLDPDVNTLCRTLVKGHLVMCELVRAELASQATSKGEAVEAQVDLIDPESEDLSLQFRGYGYTKEKNEQPCSGSHIILGRRRSP